MIDDITKEKLISLFSNVYTILKDEGFNQKEYVIPPLNALMEGNISSFIDKVKDANLWGGAGSVLDCEFRNSKQDKEFKNILSEIVEILLDHQIHFNGIKSTLKFLKSTND